MIDSWYDRHTKDYVIQVKDDEGNQIGEAVRVGNKEERDYIIRLMEQERGKDEHCKLYHLEGMG